MPGARCTPRSRAQWRSGCAHEHTGSAEASGIPCVMALRLMPCSPRRRIRLVTVVSGLMAHLSPIGPTCLRRRGASNGHQDHTVLPYATHASPGGFAGPGTGPAISGGFGKQHRSSACRLPLTGPATRPAIRFMPDAAASTASRPNVRDDRDTPLVSAKSVRMCERAVRAKPPVAGTEPVTPKRRQSL